MFMFRSINEWRQNRDKSLKSVADNYFYIQSPERDRELSQIVSSALQMELDRNATVNLIRDIFTDPAHAPEDVPVQFVKDNLDKIMDIVRQTPDEKFATPIGYTEAMLQNSNQQENVFLTKESKLFKDIPGIIIEGNIVYIPDTTKLSTTFNKRIIDFLKQNHTKNLINHIKWTRKTRK